MVKPAYLAAGLLAAAALSSPATAATAATNYICPDPSVETLTGFAPTNPFDSRTLDGKRTKSARRQAAEHDCTIRVVRRNGNDLVVTEDFSFSRIDVAVKNRRITKVFGVY
ncbi:MAG: hypothetical protein QOG62_2350 [Thermoleophilaceae bacterium]|jgi:hypothetical protein|nr:hypothetical protein [Thermoleophilaceae bacterium]